MKVFNLAEELEKERKKNKELKKQLNCKKEFTKYLPKDTEFIILTKPDYDRQQEKLQDKVFELEERISKAIEYIKERTTDEDTGEYLGYSDMIDDEILLNILKGSDNNGNN